MRTLLFTYFFAVGLTLFAQSGWKESTLKEFTEAIMKIESQTPPNSSYSFQTDYFFYGGLTTDVSELEMSASLICSKGKEIYIDQFGRYIVQNQELNVICDTVSKEIILSDPNPELFTKKTTSDFDVLYNTKCTVEKKISGNQIGYYLRFPDGFSYIGAEIWIQNSTQLSKYILYSNNEVLIQKDGSEVSVQPRMEAIFKNYAFGSNVSTAKMKFINEFVIKDRTGNYILNTKYGDYQLIDLRTTN